MQRYSSTLVVDGIYAYEISITNSRSEVIAKNSVFYEKRNGRGLAAVK